MARITAAAPGAAACIGTDLKGQLCCRFADPKGVSR